MYATRFVHIRPPRSRDTLVIIQAGQKQEERFPERPEFLFRGTAFRNAFDWARSVVPNDYIRVLCPEPTLGLVEVTKKIPPYWTRPTDPDAISVEKLRAQARRQGLFEVGRVIGLARGWYARMIRELWPDAELPMVEMKLPKADRVTGRKTTWRDIFEQNWGSLPGDEKWKIPRPLGLLYKTGLFTKVGKIERRTMRVLVIED